MNKINPPALSQLQQFFKRGKAYRVKRDFHLFSIKENGPEKKLILEGKEFRCLGVDSSRNIYNGDLALSVRTPEAQFELPWDGQNDPEVAQNPQVYFEEVGDFDLQSAIAEFEQLSQQQNKVTRKVRNIPG